MDNHELETRVDRLADELAKQQLVQKARMNGLRHAVATALVALTGQGGKLDDLMDKLQQLEQGLLPDTHADTAAEIAALREALRDGSGRSHSKPQTGFQRPVE
ncbi:MAG: hypothetical protein ACRYGP_16840 [Janthinobacterium lividum]